MKSITFIIVIIFLSVMKLSAQKSGPASELNETLMSPFWEFYSPVRIKF